MQPGAGASRQSAGRSFGRGGEAEKGVWQGRDGTGGNKLVVRRETRVDAGAVRKVKEHREEAVVPARLVEEGGAAVGVHVGRHKAALDVLGADPRHALVVRRVRPRLPRAVRDTRLVHLVDTLVAEPCNQLSFPPSRSCDISRALTKQRRKRDKPRKLRGRLNRA